MNGGRYLRLKETREQAMSDTNVDAIVGKTKWGDHKGQHLKL